VKAQGHKILPVLVFGLCAAAGWIAGRDRAPSDVEASTTGTMASKTDRSPAKGGEPSEVTAMLAPLRAAGNTEERLRATIQLADNIPLADIERWLSSGWFKGGEDMQANLFQRSLLSRWQEADPGRMLEYCLRRDIRITYEFSQDWASREPAAALALIEGQTNPQMRSSMLGQMGAALAKADPQLVLSRITGLAKLSGADNQYEIQGILHQLAESAPALLEAQLATLPRNAQDLARRGLARSSLRKDFAGGLAGLLGQKDGMQTFAEVVGSDQDLMKKVAGDPGSLPPGWLGAVTSGPGSYYMVHENPAQWLEIDLAGLGLNENEAENIRNQALSRLGGKNPEKLKALISGGTLNEDENRIAVQGLVFGLDTQAAADWIAGLTDEAELQAAKEALASKAGSSDAEEVTPSSLLGDIAANGREISWAETRLIGKWDREQIQALNDGFDALTAEQKGAVAARFITRRDRQMPVEFQGKALAYLLENPDARPAQQDSQSIRDRSLANSACDLAARWADQDPAAAAAWVTKLPEGTERLWAAKNLAARWAEYEPAAVQRWIGSLSASERAEVTTFMNSGGAIGR
jgi:hypothetical protein